jgi:glycosyltransferase involved in cell wall biosynthesis
MQERMEKIKVLQLVEDFKIGGLERVVATLFDGLNKDKYEPSIWCIAGGGELTDEFIQKNKDIKILSLKTYHNPLNIVKLAFLIRNRKFHIVHTHGYYASTMGRISAFLVRTPVIIAHVHTTYWNFKKRHLRIEKVLSWITDCIICCASAVKDFVISNEKINPHKITTIYNGIHYQKWEEGEPVTYYSDKKVIQIIITASLVENKGHKYLLEALSKIVKRHHNVKLNIVGDGPLRSQLVSYAGRLGISDHIEFFGIVNDVQTLLKNCDIFVLPSIAREGLSIAIIEAMWLAKPVIASNIGGNAELVNDGINGYLVPPKDSDALTEKLEILIGNRKLCRLMGVEGNKKFKNKFDASVMVKKIEELYDSLLDNKNIKRD